LDKRILGEVYNSTEAWENLLVLCDDFGSRFDGTEDARKAADFILDCFRRYRTNEPHLEEYRYQGWVRGPALLTMVSPISREIPCISLPYCHASEVEGKLVFVGDGTEEDYERAKDEIPGNIVMAKTSSPAGDRWMHRMEKYDRAALMGAAGFIWMQHVDNLGPETGSIGWNHDAIIPGVGIAKEHGEFLVRHAERHGEVRLRVKTTDQLKPMTAYNIVCSVGGARVPDEYVVLGCHVDGHDISQGARDPASGTVVVMEAARVLATIADRLDRTVRCVIYSNEEVGLFGSLEDVRMHESELAKTRYMLNLDAAGVPRRKGFVLHSWPELEAFFRSAGEEMGGLPVQQGRVIAGFSDHFPYFLEGVPTGALGEPGGPPPSGRGVGHVLGHGREDPPFSIRT
jgi:Iap family predicted aminopeptidase